jgi:hypothetical protein
MNVASIASAFIATQVSQLQTAAAAKMMKMDADAASDIAKMIDAAQQNAQSPANVAEGIGQTLDISV